MEGSLSEQADQLLKAIGLATQPTSPAAASSAAQSAMQRAQSKELADAKADLAVTKSALMRINAEADELRAEAAEARAAEARTARHMNLMRTNERSIRQEMAWGGRHSVR